ncbi:MAG: hypothetical protein RBG13Loki_1009 [Promethearchaeota archaeon CR_4]|nr:MAG: hypothetical protein RBG13Loki_1009 [Candidatus Lokiarchaeota archaeon CR_4]
MNERGRPESIDRIMFFEVFASAIFVGFMWAIFLYLTFVALLYFSTVIIGTPEFLSVIASVLVLLALLLYRRVDKRPKLKCFRGIVPCSFLLMGGTILIVLNINPIINILALLMIGTFIIPGSVTLVITLSAPGFFSSSFQRGKVVSIIILIIFGFLAAATTISLAFPVFGFRAGLLFFGVVSLALIPFSAKMSKSSSFQYIAGPREKRNTPESSTSFKHDRKQYYIVVFLFEICLGMLLRVFLSLPSEIASMDGVWFVISIVALVISPIIGVIADQFGRKIVFALASGVTAVMFGLFAFSGQATGDQWFPIIVFVCLILFGVAYPAILVSQFAIFPELSDDILRLRIIAWCLFLHVTGIAAGLVISALFDTPDMAYFFLATNFLTIGLLVTSNARETLPDKEELLWPKVIRHLYIYHSQSGTGIYDTSFEGSSSPHHSLVTGGLAGISRLIGEVTRRDGHLTSIQQQDATILFNSGQYITAALVVEKTLNTLHVKLKDLVTEFEDLFQEYLRDFTRDVVKYTPTESLVRRIFRPK